MHGTEEASAWVRRWAHLVPAQGMVLDVACGHGRHTRFFALRGCRVTCVDRDAQAIEPLRTIAEVVEADIEGSPWPFASPFAARTFDAVVVTNYLWRPLLPAIVACVAPSGVLIYETFMMGNEKFGKPSRPDFLLRPGELLGACSSLDVTAFEQGLLSNPDRAVQRIAAVGKSRGSTPLESPFPGEKSS